MIHRTARERLLAEAREAPEHVGNIEGVRGHSATLERSDHGAARMVRVWHDGSVVSWSFSLEPGEGCPAFYPPDLPFWSDMHCEVTWDDELGLIAKWRGHADARRLSEFRDNIEAFKKRVQDLTGEPLGSGTPVTPAQRREALEVLAGSGHEERLAERINEIVAFHKAIGWNQVSDPGSGPVVRVILKRGGVERSLIATGLGVPTIVLGEEGPGARESVQEQPGPAKPRAGLRLRMD